MRNLMSSIKLAVILCLVSCSPKAYFNYYVGTWKPLDSTSYPVISKFQIEKRDNFYILGAEFDTGSSQPFFFVCDEKRNHLSISPSQYNSQEYNLESMLTQRSDIYFDKELNCLYFLNTIYVPSKEKVFEIIDKQIRFVPTE
jgi:hypothetical protein